MRGFSKASFHDIQGWSNESELQTDELVLRNLLERKVQNCVLPSLVLPEKQSLSPTRSKGHSKALSKASPQRRQSKMLPHSERETSLERTCEKDVRCPLRQKLLQIMSQEVQMTTMPNTDCVEEEQLGETEVKGSPLQKNSKSQTKLDNLKNIRPIHARAKTFQSKQQLKDSTVFKRYEVEQKSKEGSPGRQRNSNPKAHIKLNTLGFDEGGYCRPLKNCPTIGHIHSKTNLEAIAAYEDRKNHSKRLHKHEQRLERASERFKTTFIKQDILTREKKKPEVRRMFEAAQFSDQQIFNNKAGMAKVATLVKKQSLNFKVNNGRGPVRYKLLLC